MEARFQLSKEGQFCCQVQDFAEVRVCGTEE